MLQINDYRNIPFLIFLQPLNTLLTDDLEVSLLSQVLRRPFPPGGLFLLGGITVVNYHFGNIM